MQHLHGKKCTDRKKETERDTLLVEIKTVKDLFIILVDEYEREREIERESYVLYIFYYKEVSWERRILRTQKTLPNPRKPSNG